MPSAIDPAPHHAPADPMPELCHESLSVLVRRQLVATMRNTTFLQGRALVVLVMGLIYSTMFYRFDAANAPVVLGVVFLIVFNLSLGQASQLPIHMAARNNLYKQQQRTTLSHVLACSASQLPVAVGESVVFGSLVYWMCGFVATAQTFLIYLALLILVSMAFAAWFFFVAAIAPTPNIARPMGMTSLLVFVLFCGYVVIKSDIPDYLVWIYWLNPIAWCIRAVAVNQYSASSFSVCEYKGVDYCMRFGKRMGEHQLGLYDMQDDKDWIWYGMLYMVTSYIACMALGGFVLEHTRHKSSETISLKKEQPSDAKEQYQLVSTPKRGGTLPRDASRTGDDDNVVLDVASRENHIVPVTLAFADVWYTVPLPSNPKESIDLLRGISGYALPGTMTALMGASGAGQTTLLDVLAGRKTSGGEKVRGKILLNGYEATDAAIRQCSGYCEQLAVHSDASTIREALTFSAFLRQDSSVPASKKYASVDECLDVLAMHDIADQLIRGSSIEQMKRLSIGVELAAQPSVLFLDEPTSGLDARSAKAIMDSVRNVANSGRTIVCTLHEPSSEVFSLFDSLLLLKRGGETVFFGDLGDGNCSHLISYFEAIPGVAPIPLSANPAKWMLECVGADVESTSGDSAVDFAQLFQASGKKRALEEMMGKRGVGLPAASEVPEATIFTQTNQAAADHTTQMWALMKRTFALYWRTPSYNLARMLITILSALLFGVMFGSADFETYHGLTSGVRMIFLAIIFNCIISFNSVLPVASAERAAFYREQQSQTYHPVWHFLGTTIAELPYTFLCGFLFTVIFYPMVGLAEFKVAVLFWINTSLMILLSTYLGQLLVYAMPSGEVAAIVGMLLNLIFFAFMGFNPPKHAIPSRFIWLYRITPLQYTFAILTALLFADCPNEPMFDEALGRFVDVGAQLGCQPVRDPPESMGTNVTIKSYVESVFDTKHDDIWVNFAIVVAFIVVFRVLALLSLRYIRHHKR